MKIKICGLKYQDNIRAISALQPDMIGFIFYPGSKRFAGDILEAGILNQLASSILKVGVFVNQEKSEVIGIAEEYHLDLVQLHGNENSSYCSHIRNKGYKVVKAVPVSNKLYKDRLLSYAGNVDYFLFDTATPGYGGSGKTFNWDMLQEYEQEIPFLLSGGLGNDNVEQILRLNHPRLFGIDASSKLEDKPGVKNSRQTLTFINTIRNATI